MSYEHSAALQSAVYVALINDPEVTALVSQNIFDALPSGSLPDMFVSLGSETVQDASDKTHSATLHDFTISVITTHSGFLEAKQVAAAVGKVLLGSSLLLLAGSLTYLNFQRATARRDTDSQTRRIDMSFRARIDNDETE